MIIETKIIITGLIVIALAVLVYLLLKKSVGMYGELNPEGCNQRIHWVQRLDGEHTCKYCGRDLHGEV